MKKIISQILCFKTMLPLLWLSAFVCALYPINDWQLWLFASACMVTFAWSFLMLSKTMMSGWALPKSPVLYLAGGFWILAAASVFWSDIKPISIMALCFFSVMPLTFFSAIIGGDEKFFKNVAKGLAVVFGVLGVWAVVQYLFLNDYFSWQARHPLADPSSLGALLSLGLFCALGWVLAARTRAQKYLATALSAILLCGILSTVARGPVFAFIPAIGLFVWLLWPQIKEHKKYLSLIALIGILFYSAGYFGANKNLDIGKRIVATAIHGVEKEHARLSLWSSTIDMIKDAPVLGRGIGTFFLYFPAYRDKDFEETIYLAHNDPLQFMAEMGLFAPLLFYGFIFAAIVRTYRALSRLKSPDQNQDRIIIISIFCALMALVLGSHVGFNHYNLSILMGEGMLLAFWFVVTSRALNEDVISKPMPKSIPSMAAKILLAAPYALLGWLLFGIVSGEHYANRAAQNLFQEDMFYFANNINKAGAMSHDQNYRAYILAVNVPLAILDMKKDKIDIDEASELYQQITTYMDKVLAINPRSAAASYYLGKAQTLVPSSIIPDGTPIAEEYYERALALDPTHLGSRLALNNLYARMQKPLQTRIAFMEGGIKFTYNMVTASQYYDEMAKLYLESKDYVKAREVMAKKYNFEERSKHSQKRQNTSIPQAFMGDDGVAAP